MNTYEMLQELRANISETVATHWGPKELLKKLSAHHRRVAAMLMLKQGDWLLKKSSALTPVAGVITLPADCAKPVYMEDVSSGAEIAIDTTVRERRWTRPLASGLEPGMLNAYMMDGVIEINDATVVSTVYLWYQRKVWDLIAGTADTASTTNAIVIAVADGPRYTDDYYIGAMLEVVGGTGIGTAAAITDYVGSTRVLTVAGSFGTDTIYGTVPQVPEEGHDLIVLGATMQAMAKPSSDVEGEIFKYYASLYTEAREVFNDWASTRKSGSTHVRRTEVD